MRLLVICLFIVSLSFSNVLGAKCTGTAKYRLTLNYMWTKARFGDILPSFPHFSPLVVHSHKGRFSAFSKYGYATPGVKDVAELGATAKIENELKTAMNKKHVRQVSIDRRVVDGDGSASVEISVSCSHRYISAITMIAPSPDWILVIFRLPVVRKGMFINEQTGQLKPYDAGTDSGKTLNAPNMKSDQNIGPLFGPPFFTKYLATYTLKKI